MLTAESLFDESRLFIGTKTLNMKGGLVSSAHSDWTEDLADTDASAQASLSALHKTCSEAATTKSCATIPRTGATHVVTFWKKQQAVQRTEGLLFRKCPFMSESDLNNSQIL